MAIEFPANQYTHFEPPSEFTTPEEWIRKVLDGDPGILKLGRRKIALINDFQPEYADYYKMLQIEISKRIPSEQDRPFICLNIRGRNRVGDGYNADIGLAGGTGPLSDATILENLVKHMSQINNEALGENREHAAECMANFSGVMYSMPPVRDLSRVYNDFYNYRSLYRSVRERLPCTSLHLLTNSGHSNKWVFDNRLFFGSKKLGPVEDMTVKVARKIQMESELGERVLVLGTIAADKDRLYANLLAKRSLDPVFPSALYERKNAKKYLQSIIDMAKSGKINDNMPDEERSCGQALIDFIVHFSEQTESKSLLFACTEVPLILHTPIPPDNNQTYFDKLTEQLGDTPYKYYDSEVIFVEEIAEKSKLLQAHPEMRSRESPQLPTPARDLNILLNEIKQNIEHHCKRFIHKTDEKHVHKRNVLLATLEYFENGNKHMLRQALLDNPRYEEASMIWGSTTLALVSDGVALMRQLRVARMEYTHNQNHFFHAQPRDQEPFQFEVLVKS